MVQYQTFPDASGDSHTLDKLKALRIPGLSGKRFLDVGCNEGFFCGFAAYAGALRSVGVDFSPVFIERARQRFPHCEFIQSDWEALPEGPFDVVLLASALHYAEDQPALVHALMSRLADDGVLILELGVVESTKNEWVPVKRGIDERIFPSMRMVHEVLARYAWKYIGTSVDQAGDPVKRHVFHVSKKRPLAFLLMQPPAYGKTSMAASLLSKSDIPIICGDDVLVRIADGIEPVSSALSETVRENFSRLRLDVTISAIFKKGFVREFLRICMEKSKHRDFVLDMYVPQEWHATVKKILADLGCLPVFLQWDKPGGVLPSRLQFEFCADAFFDSLKAASGRSQHAGKPAALSEDGQGVLDEVSYQNDNLVLTGWAFDGSGKLPAGIQIKLGGVELLIADYERQCRPDVQRALGLPHALVGYRIALYLPGLKSLALDHLKLQISGGALIKVNDKLGRILDAGK